MNSCPYSSIVFLILALVLDNFIYKILFLQLCVSSTMFHMYDHEILPQREIYNIYYYDMFSILIIGLYIVTKNIYLSLFICIIIMILYKKINRFSVFFYLLGLSKILYKLFNKENNILILLICIIAFISHYDNTIPYTVEPYHMSWRPSNALIWHLCNATFIYLYLQ